MGNQEARRVGEIEWNHPNQGVRDVGFSMLHQPYDPHALGHHKSLKRSP